MSSLGSQLPVEFMMDIATSIADLTQTLELCQQIPAYLSDALDVETITLAIIADPKDHAPAEILLQASSGQLAGSETRAVLTQTLLGLFAQTKPLSHLDGPAMRHDVESTTHQNGAFGQVTVFARSLDSQHRMLLLVHHAASPVSVAPNAAAPLTPSHPALSAGLTKLLPMIADLLAKLLSCLTVWHERSETLGGEFDRLTSREWVVLQGLTSEAGEKQLADQLKLSPHTLHSHIKSIYRKTGVQGRLLLLNKVHSAMRALRAARLSRVEKTNGGGTPATPKPAAVAAG